MAITRIGAGSAEAATVTIPGTYQNGDLIIIYAFRSAVTAPSLPAGWTNLNNISGGASSYRIGWKLAGSASETSGTWTNATGLICQVYRGVSTNKTPVVNNAPTTGTGTTVTYVTLALSEANTSWLAAFSATKTIDSTIETAPTNLTNATNTVGAAAEYAGFDSNGAYSAGQGTWPSTSVSVAGTSAEWRSTIVEIFAEQGLPNNYQFVKVGDGMSSSEKIR